MKTPMADAIFSMMGNLRDKLSDIGASPGAVRAYIFGGCAVHLYTASRSSEDLDVELFSTVLSKRDIQLVTKNVEPVYFVDSEGDAAILAYDRNFNTTLGPLHEDYQDRALVIDGDDSSPLLVCLPSPEDLALSKLGRLGEDDVSDIVLLMSLPNASWEKLSTLTEEASKYYVGRPGELTGKLEYVRNHRK